MARRWNIFLWAGFVIIVAAFALYPTVFVRFPVTRDLPWASLLMFGAGLVLLSWGLRRAYREPESYRGRISGPILLALGIAIAGFFCFVFFHLARQIPAATGAPQVGGRAPDFILPDQDGRPVTLSKLIEPGADGAGHLNGVLLIFYRGFW
jgi:hypothetical protein